MSPLRSVEIVVEGHWRSDASGTAIADAATSRIEGLLRSHLAFVAASSDGWSRLFRDPNDGRLWEHTYPQSEMHGGGPPRLQVITSDMARLRYSVAL